MLKLENEKIKSALKFWIIVIGITIFATIPYLSKEDIWADDFTYHLNRILSIANEFKAGNFPSLIHFTLLDGFGYANPLFYPELFLHIPAVLINAGLDILFTYKFFIIMITFFTIIVTYFSAKRIFNNESISWNVTLLYVLSTYRLGDVFVRAAIGELLSFLFLPLVLLGLYEIIFGENKKWWIICFGIWGVVNSHVLTTVMTAGIILFMCAINIVRILKDKKRLTNLVIAGVISILLSLSYFLPYIEQNKNDIFVKDMIRVNGYETVINGQFLSDHASSFQDLLKNDLEGFGFEFSKGLLLILLPVLILRCKNIKYKKDTFLIQCIVMGIITIIVTSKLFPWKSLEILAIFQFPYRISILATLFLSFVSGFVMYEVFDNKKDMQTIMIFLILLIVGTQLANVDINRRVDVNGVVDERYVNESPIGNKEYLPMNFKNNISYVYNINDPDIEIEFTKQNKKVEFYYDYDNDFNINIPFTYYKGYIAYVEDNNGNKTDITVEKNPNNSNVLIVSEEKVKGDVTVEYKMTVIQIISYIISYTTLLALLCYIVINSRKKK